MSCTNAGCLYRPALLTDPGLRWSRVCASRVPVCACPAGRWSSCCPNGRCWPEPDLGLGCMDGALMEMASSSSAASRLLWPCSAVSSCCLLPPALGSPEASARPSQTASSLLCCTRGAGLRSSWANLGLSPGLGCLAGAGSRACSGSGSACLCSWSGNGGSSPAGAASGAASSSVSEPAGRLEGCAGDLGLLLPLRRRASS